MTPPAVAPPDQAAAAAAVARQATLTKPPGSLGRLEDLSVWAAAVQGRCPPRPFTQARLLIVAGDHGAAAVTSAFPPQVTAQMVANFVAGGAAATVLARAQDIAVRIVDAAVDSDYEGLPVPSTITDERIRRGSGRIDREDALTAEQAGAAVALGRRLADGEIASGADLLIVGDMGIGNTTPAAALVAAITGADVFDVTGRGTGIDDDTWMRKAAVIRDALWRVRTATAATTAAGPAADLTGVIREHPMALLARVGGADLGVMAGIVAQAAARGTPVLLDGAVVTAAALLADLIAPGARQWWLAGHRSVEPAHTLALERLELRPVLDLGMRLGEGSGALTALPVLQQAIAVLADMATFAGAGISGANASDDEA